MECVNIEQQTKQFERLMQIQSTICDTVAGQRGIIRAAESQGFI